MNRLSVCVITKNASKHIKDFLEAVSWADEIIIMDNMSDDKTVEIAQAYPNIKVYIRKIEGLFGTYRNYPLSKATGEWILFLDADEIVSAELAEEIKEAIKDKAKLGYFLSRKNIFLGQWIKSCGWWPEYIMRLFRKGITQWPKEIHATPIIDDKSHVGYLKNPLIHHSYLSINDFFIKFNFYTTQLAYEKYERGIRISKFNFFVFFLIKPLLWFFLKYFYWRGFRDGFRGFFISFSSALVIFTTYAKLWERQKDK